MLVYAFNESDSVDQVRIKGHQISIYCLSLVIKECKLENPKLQYQNFDRQLSKFIDRRVDYLKD